MGVGLNGQKMGRKKVKSISKMEMNSDRKVKRTLKCY